MPQGGRSDAIEFCSSRGSAEPSRCSCATHSSGSGSRSGTGSSYFCSCSAYASCYYYSSAHTADQKSTIDRNSVGSEVGERDFAPFRKDEVLEAPQLLQVRALSFAKGTCATKRGGPDGDLFTNNKNTHTGTALGLPPFPRHIMESNRAQDLGDSFLHRECNVSVAVQTQGGEKISRSTSPVVRAAGDTAVQTEAHELHQTELEMRISHLCAQNDELRLQFDKMEKAFAAAQKQQDDQHEREQQQRQQLLHQQQHERDMHRELCARMAAQRAADCLSRAGELFAAEAVCRGALLQSEAAVRAALGLLQPRELRELREGAAEAKARREAEEEAEAKAKAKAKAEAEALSAAEAKAEAAEAERREERRRFEEAAAKAAAEKGRMEQLWREAVEREKELRLQLLHVLRLPTTTIAVHAAEDKACDGGKDGDANMSVHARFVRAHREAVAAVMAQRRRVPLLL